ncbi:MAG: hypothetical protein ACR2PQ_09215 [Myxococcota bacterium]
MQRGSELVDILMRTDLVTEADLQRARARQESRGGSLLESLVLGGVSEVDLARALSGALRLPVVNLQGKRIDPEVLALVPRAIAEKYGCLPLFMKIEQGNPMLYLGLEDPTDPAVLDDVSRRAGVQVRPVVVGPIQLRAGLRASYPEPEVPSLSEPVGLEPRVDGADDDEETAPQWRESPPADSRTASAEPAAVSASEAGRRAKPRDVSTRVILRALLQVLIEKEVITRGELLAAVDEIRSGSNGPDSHS